MPRTGTGRIYLRGDTWWIDYSFRGKRYRESSESTQRKAATDLLKRRLVEQGSGRFIGRDAERVTFKDLADMIATDYKVNRRRSADRLGIALGHLRDYFGDDCRALDITTDRVSAYIAHRQDEGAANASIMKELAALKRAFNLAVQAGRLATRPHIPSVKVDNTREGFFGKTELARVIAELPADLRPVVRFGALTGWRKAEVLSLAWSQVDWDAGEIRLYTSKNYEGRSFPFRALPPLAALLEEQRERTRKVERETGRIVPWIFHRNGREIRYMDTAWRSATKRAGLAGWLFHDLRRTAVRELERAGVPRSVAMKLSGHKTESVYRRYAIADAAALAEGVEKLARLHASQPAERKVLPISKRAAQ